MSFVNSRQIGKSKSDIIKVREISEGRMRADAKGGGPMPVPSEGRVRAAGQVL